jgi:RNA polymerase-binding protein DksA
MNIAKFRKLLLAEKARVEQQIHGVEALDEASTAQDEVGDLSGYDQHQADSATLTFEREKDLAIEDSLKDELEQIEMALSKIDAGTYGICDRCKKPIAEPRLQALPYATLCINCASTVGRTL